MLDESERRPGDNRSGFVQAVSGELTVSTRVEQVGKDGREYFGSENMETVKEYCKCKRPATCAFGPFFPCLICHKEVKPTFAQLRQHVVALRSSSIGTFEKETK